MAPPAAGCFRYLAARPTSAARLACSPPFPTPSEPAASGEARGGADWARAAAPNFASNGCDDAFNSVRAGAEHLLDPGALSVLCSPVVFTPISPDQTALCKKERTDVGFWRLLWCRSQGFEEEVKALLKTEE